MSGPFRFQQDSSRSPLDRRPQQPLPTQPVSFKTNVNRMKTKKWVEAKKNAYDGDDWGDYDEYDEYGASEQEPPEAHYAAPHARSDQPGRSFTEPQRQPPRQAGRRNSFEAGEEQRAFSASIGPPPQPFSAQHGQSQPQSPPNQQYVHPALRQVSGGESDVSDTPEHRRNFSPSAMPPPLNTRIATGPGSASSSPSTRFPPRKSSIGQADSPAAMSPRGPAGNSEKPLPFIRPADIYKRFEEEKERTRASLDEQRPNVETTSGPPTLPPVTEGLSTSDGDFRSVVDQAFTRPDDQRSVPPTPITKSDSSVSRSNTDSTSGISPIMSRVPSSATSALKTRNLAGGDGSTPVIAEEASEGGTPVVSRPTSSALLSSTHQIPRKASPAHSRNVSSSSIPTTPNTSDSPARSPAITPRAHVPEPAIAELGSLNTALDDAKIASPTDATTRESDIADAMKLSPVKAHPELSAAEKESQDAFLESHQASGTIAEAVSRSRSESPSKGRVQELAGKFGDVSHSRRGSTQSNASQTSLQSWEKSGENSRPASPTKASIPSGANLGSRPAAEREASFRPKLPGQWESYATNSASPNKELSTDNLPATSSQISSPLEEVDLTPTTTKHPVATVDPPKSDSNPLTNPLAALKAAGAAVGDAVQTSVGLGSSPTNDKQREPTHGQVLPRPLQLHREESSASTIPPTPPAKDSPEFEEMPPPPPLKERSPEPRSAIASSVPQRPVPVPQLSTDTADDDQESDRLRKEIVASLTPRQSTTGLATDLNSAALQPGSAPVNRESSSFPSEYESYWADGDRTSQQSDDGRDLQTHTNGANNATANPLTQSPEDATKPSILTRFSWEAGSSGLLPNKLQESPTKIASQAEDEEKIPAPAVEQAGKDQAKEAAPGMMPDLYFGPTHGVTAVKPEPISDADLNARSPTTDVASPAISPLSDIDRTASPTTGLHVVNSALNPEAIDLPARLSREVSPVSDAAGQNSDMSTKDSSTLNRDSVPNPAMSAPVFGTQEPAMKEATTSPTSDKPLGFKDILQIKSPGERIAHYNKTRDYWAHADHGLGEWVKTALSANPDLVLQPFPQARPQINTSGTIRHRPTGSISLFGKSHGASSSQAEAASPSASQTPMTPTGASPLGGGRSASHQMQAKGKDLLHTAGLLSGKGMTGAKGLFAKGKSRFKSDKATSESEASSREASEEPLEVGSMYSGKLIRRMSLDTTASLTEEKKKHRRRFSSPFRRSRSRPSSVILPSIESTPRSTAAPSRPRPRSYHPLDTWSSGPSVSSSTPPDRLGVLPSPAKSAFSYWGGQQEEGEVPRVPALPHLEAVEGEGKEMVSSRLLQSVVRHATPPIGEPSALERDRDGRVQVEHQQRRPGSEARQHAFPDVSPMMHPTTLDMDVPESDEDDQATPIADVPARRREAGFKYETELVGGDLSPISSHGSGDEEKTPTKTDGGEADGDGLRVDVPAVSVRDDLGEGLKVAVEISPRPKPHQQLSAYRVVHAVEYLHSQSSFGSWDQESLAAPSQSGDNSPLGRQEPDDLGTLSTPPELQPFLAVDQETTGSSKYLHGHRDTSKNKTCSTSPGEVPIESDNSQGDPHQSPHLAKAEGAGGLHKRSESLISKMSSMVSADGASISPVSSTYGPRSRPPSANRFRSPGAERHPLVPPIPVQIKEEPNSPDRIVNSAVDNHDFDLYADHNGLVNGVKDEQGRPLRLATDHSSSEKSPPPASSPSKPTPPSAPMEEPSRRCSDERPMSFIMGPRDANGRPQDEINRPGRATTDPVPPLPNTRVQRSSQLPIGPVPVKKVQKPRAQPNMRLLEQPSQADLGSNNVSPLSSYRESNKSSPHSNVSPPPVSNASPPPQKSPPPSLSDRPLLESSPKVSQPSSPTKPFDARLVQDPRAMMEAQMRAWAPGQPNPQDARLRTVLPAQATQMPGSSTHPSLPRNQYERQQIMALQAMQAPEYKPLPASARPAKKEDKFSRQKLSSVFKGLGKSNSSAPHAPQAPLQPTPQQMQQLRSNTLSPLGAGMDNTKRSASLQSGVSDLSSGQMAPPKERRASVPPNRTPSLGQESHVSQDSTRVQVSDSRLDLRYPTSPQGMPPQHPPQHAFQHAQTFTRQPNYRASVSQVPETAGKKKRFSALGSIFNRGAVAGAALPTKVKMSKEEKKAQKAQKHSSAMPLQTVPQGQQWAPQQYAGLQQYGGNQYGQPPVSPFPGMSPISPQSMQQQQQQQLQSMSPISPQVMHPHGMHQQYMQPPAEFQRRPQVGPSQMPPQFQQMPAVPQGSAYMDARHMAQTMQAQRIEEQSRPPTQQSLSASRPGGPSAPPSFHQSVQQREKLVSSPVNEYFKPDLKTIKPLPPIQQQPVQQPQYYAQPAPQQYPTTAPQHAPNPRSVSAPTAVPLFNPASHVAQRQVSAPLDEPQYETPPIPGAYTHVSGAFVSPQSEEAALQVAESHQMQHYNRQYSDPQMQPISPQVSAMTTSPPNLRQDSNESVVSPISNPSPGLLPVISPQPNVKSPKQRMTSITEQAQSENPWNLGLPQGATDQEIVRAHQRQYIEQQLLAQEQLHAERTGRSPSPRSGQSNQSTTPPPPPPTQEHGPHRESGGFRELLPRSSPQPYPVASQPPSEDAHPMAPAPVHPLPTSPDPPAVQSPVNPAATSMPPHSSHLHTPLSASFPSSRRISQDAASTHTHDSLYDPPPPLDASYQHPAHRHSHSHSHSHYEDDPPAEQPPPYSYSGPGIPPTLDMDKDTARPRPPSIVTATVPDQQHRGRLPSPRSRQPSLGILQHPQPASMAASPARSSADMGADILRRQLLEAEERERRDRLARAEAQRREHARERAERERARQRARELERSVSGGGRVGSLRVAGGSGNGSGSGRGFGGSGGGATRPVYELPAEDDEPVMRATSFPGQEWVPTWTEE